MSDTRVEAPKMFREMEDLELTNVELPDAEETLWHCRRVSLKNVRVERADYLFMHSEHIRIADYRQQGNYSFQYCRDVEICNAEIHSKDAFWNSEDVTVYDSTLDGEYLVGELPHQRYAAVVLCARPCVGELHDGRRCRFGI